MREFEGPARRSTSSAMSSGSSSSSSSSSSGGGGGPGAAPPPPRTSAAKKAATAAAAAAAAAAVAAAASSSSAPPLREQKELKEGKASDGPPRRPPPPPSAPAAFSFSSSPGLRRSREDESDGDVEDIFNRPAFSRPRTDVVNPRYMSSAGEQRASELSNFGRKPTPSFMDDFSMPPPPARPGAGWGGGSNGGLYALSSPQPSPAPFMFAGEMNHEDSSNIDSKAMITSSSAAAVGARFPVTYAGINIGMAHLPGVVMGGAGGGARGGGGPPGPPRSWPMEMIRKGKGSGDVTSQMVIAINSSTPLKSPGRTDPCAPQAMMTMVVKHERDTWIERAKYLDSLVPVGSEQDYDAEIGDNLYTIPDDGYGKRQGSNGTPDCVAFSSSNGLPAHVQMLWIGQMKNTSRHNDPGKFMDSITVETAGAMTLTNTGWMTIKPMDMVAMVHTAYEVKGKGGRVRQPFVEVEGQPKTKFSPVPLVWTESDQVALMLRYRGAAQQNQVNILAAIVPPVPVATVVEGANRLRGWYDMIAAGPRKIWEDKQFSENTFPLQMYAMYMSLLFALRACIHVGNTPLAELGFLQESQNIIREIQLAERIIFEPVPLSPTPGTTQGMISVPDSTAEVSAVMAVVFNPAAPDRAGLELVTRLFMPQLLEKWGQVALLEQSRWCRRNVIGICRKGGAPGQMIDIQAGYVVTG